MENLKPCPFCGGEAYIKRIGYGHNGLGKFVETYEIGCKACSIRFTKESIFKMEKGQPVYHKNGYEDCVKAWNTRMVGKGTTTLDREGIRMNFTAWKEEG